MRPHRGARGRQLDHGGAAHHPVRRRGIRRPAGPLARGLLAALQGRRRSSRRPRLRRRVPSAPVRGGGRRRRLRRAVPHDLRRGLRDLPVRVHRGRGTPRPAAHRGHRHPHADHGAGPPRPRGRRGGPGRGEPRGRGDEGAAQHGAHPRLWRGRHARAPAEGWPHRRGGSTGRLAPVHQARAPGEGRRRRAGVPPADPDPVPRVPRRQGQGRRAPRPARRGERCRGGRRGAAVDARGGRGVAPDDHHRSRPGGRDPRRPRHHRRLLRDPRLRWANTSNLPPCPTTWRPPSPVPAAPA